MIYFCKQKTHWKTGNKYQRGRKGSQNTVGNIWKILWRTTQSKEDEAKKQKHNLFNYYLFIFWHSLPGSVTFVFFCLSVHCCFHLCSPVLSQHFAYYFFLPVCSLWLFFSQWGGCRWTQPWPSTPPSWGCPSPSKIWDISWEKGELEAWEDDWACLVGLSVPRACLNGNSSLFPQFLFCRLCASPTPAAAEFVSGAITPGEQRKEA